jgi:glycosyltransferase involved in cell wall biosynthesis
VPLKVLVINHYKKVQPFRPEAEMLMRLHQEPEVQVDVISPTNYYYPQAFREAGMRVFDMHPQKKVSLSSIRQIRQLIKEEQYDVVELFNSKAIINGIWAAIGLPVKVVLYRGFAGHIHWYDPASYLKYLHPRVDAIICIADAIRDTIRQQLFTNEDKAVTIHKGHDPAWYQDIEPADLQRAFGIPEEAFVAINVANARPMKAIHNLVRATNYLPEDLPFHLILVGKGMDTPTMKELVEASPHKDRIHVCGYREEPLSLVAAADTFVLSSLYGEAITKSVIEAMALGTTPVITDIPGNRALVSHEENGLQVPPDDPEAIAQAIYRLQQNPEWNACLGKKARSHIFNNFNISTTVGETKELFMKLAGKEMNRS